MNDQTESTLTDLLDEWAELEPERCQTDDFLPDKRLYSFPGLDGAGVTTSYDGSGLAGRAHIQAAVQEAIEERGWNMFLDLRASGWKARVNPTPDSSGKYFDGKGGPAYALLSAYLKALRK